MAVCDQIKLPAQPCSFESRLQASCVSLLKPKLFREKQKKKKKNKKMQKKKSSTHSPVSSTLAVCNTYWT